MSILSFFLSESESVVIIRIELFTSIRKVTNIISSHDDDDDYYVDHWRQEQQDFSHEIIFEKL
jgi:hypothetical protein